MSDDQATPGRLTRGLPRLPAARPDLLRRPHRPPRLLPQRVRGAAPLVDRAGLRRPGGAVPVPARPRQQPGGLRPGTDARRPLGGARGVDGLHPPLGDPAGTLRHGRRPVRGTHRPGPDPRSQGHRRGHRRPCGVGHGTQPLPRPAPRRNRAGRGIHRGTGERPAGPGSGHRRRRRCRHAALPHPRRGRGASPDPARLPPRRPPGGGRLRRAAGGPAAAGLGHTLA